MGKTTVPGFKEGLRKCCLSTQMQSDLFITPWETVYAACFIALTYAGTSTGEGVDFCSTSRVLKSTAVQVFHMHDWKLTCTGQMRWTRWSSFDFAWEDARVHYSRLHVGVTPAASHLRRTAAPQVTELIAHFHPQHESRLMTSSTLPSLAFVWNGAHREIRGKGHVQASLCTPQTRSLPLPLKVAAINFSCPLCSH